jgi:hypothetical protein
LVSRQGISRSNARSSSLKQVLMIGRVTRCATAYSEQSVRHWRSTSAWHLRAECTRIAKCRSNSHATRPASHALTYPENTGADKDGVRRRTDCEVENDSCRTGCTRKSPLTTQCWQHGSAVIRETTTEREGFIAMTGPVPLRFIAAEWPFYHVELTRKWNKLGHS